ncbi:MAG: hypothetical protein CYPHOPRED_005776, partial [Cyphobasidiales sp. Tagirdzhanova-0007]
MALTMQNYASVLRVDGSLNTFEGVHWLIPIGSAAVSYRNQYQQHTLLLPVSSQPKIRYDPYSLLGHFLGPGSTEVATRYVVEDLRTTKSFVTRKVEAWQDWSSLPGKKQDSENGGRRRISVLLLDFHVPVGASMFEYNDMPLHATPSPSTTSHGDSAAFIASISENCSSPDKLRTPADFFFSSYPPQKSAQLDVPFTRRSNSIWSKLRHPPSFPTPFGQPNEAEASGVHEAAVAFFMDATLGAVPLSFSSRSLQDASSFSTLELSLRFLRPPDFSEWMLEEQTTEAGSGERTGSTGKVWDMQGRLVAVLTNFSIMWPRLQKHDGKSTKPK